MLTRWLKGRKAEAAASSYLKKRGIKVIARNYRDRRGELDIIARENNQLCIVEVRSRGESSPYVPEASLSPSKVRHLSDTTSRFLKKHRLFHVPVRMDLLVIDWGRDEIRFYPGGIIPPPLR